MSKLNYLYMRVFLYNIKIANVLIRGGIILEWSLEEEIELLREEMMKVAIKKRTDC